MNIKEGEQIYINTRFRIGMPANVVEIHASRVVAEDPNGIRHTIYPDQVCTDQLTATLGGIHTALTAAHAGLDVVRRLSQTASVSTDFPLTRTGNTAETSPEVSTLASRVMNGHIPDAEEAKTLAASCLSQS